jgi:hypothetical protein
VDNWYNPRQKWLTSKIPNTWIDKDYLLEIVILESVKHYVEGEESLKGFEKSQNDPDYPEHQKVFDREVKLMYESVTITLPKLEEQLEIAWTEIPKLSIDDIQNCRFSETNYEQVYGKVDVLEKQISNLKTSIMVWFVANRERMWT